MASRRAIVSNRRRNRIRCRACTGSSPGRLPGLDRGGTRRPKRVQTRSVEMKVYEALRALVSAGGAKRPVLARAGHPGTGPRKALLCEGDESREVRVFMIELLKASNGAGLPAQGASRRSAAVNGRSRPARDASALRAQPLTARTA